LPGKMNIVLPNYVPDNYNGKTMKKGKTVILGLTGGIATGKSLVALELSALGAKIIDADKIAHEVYQKNKPAYKKILKAFGPAILANNKEVDRKKLGELIFADAKKRVILEKITHPEIIKEIKHEIKTLSKDNSIVVVDAPLLFEAKIQSLFDKIIVVYTPVSQQAHRLMERDKISKQEALKKIAAQIDIEKKKKLADYVIDNTGDIENTLNLAKTFWMNLLFKQLLGPY